MREHAVPQNVTSYQFHLIGNMTLKQFLELAAGVVLAFLVYRTNLPNLIKYPIAITLAGGGAMLAFIPFEGRPLDQWFIAFIKAIYKPTKFYWKKSSHIPDYFTYSPDHSVNLEQELDLTPYKRQRIQEYIGSLPSDQSPFEYLNVQEAKKINALTSLFDEVAVMHQPTISLPAEPEKPDVTQEPHVLKPLDKLQTNSKETLVAKSEKKNKNTLLKGATAPVAASNSQPAQSTTTQPANENLESAVEYQYTPKPFEPQPEGTVQDALPVLKIPENKPVAIDANQSDAEPAIPEPTPLSRPQNAVDVFSSTNAPAQPTAATQPATTSTDLPFPKKPSQPNLITGMVFDQNGKIVDNAIIEINDADGLPVRAVKTNSIGQFFVTTPLKNGEYVINIEKSDYQFAPLSIRLKGKIVDPLVISGQLTQLP